MTRHELQELGSRPGHEIGAHTVHHLFLPVHPSDLQKREMQESKAALEELTGERVRALAYPYGACDLTTTRVAEEAGFEIAVSSTRVSSWPTATQCGSRGWTWRRTMPLPSPFVSADS